MKKLILTSALIAVTAAFVNAQNPIMVKDIDTTLTQGSNPSSFVSFKNKLYFTADSKRWNGFGNIGNRELWCSNGSEVGTKMVVDLGLSGTTNIGSNPQWLKVWKNKIYFFAGGADSKQNLYETDGTELGTKQITTSGLASAIPNGRDREAFVEFNNELYFIANDYINGSELWKTDGTEAGTVMLKEINPAKGMYDNSSEIRQLTVMGNTLYFFANETATDDSLQIWKTNGTTAGTEKIVSYKVNNDLSLYSLTATATNLYYTYNSSLYKCDGTAAGISLFIAGNSPEHLTSFKGELLFLTTKSSPVPTASICITSNDTQGYTILKEATPSEINTSINSTYYYQMNIVDDKLYFDISIAGPITQLWQSDGTLAGTILVKAIPQTDGYIQSQQFIKHNNEVYFTTELNGDRYLNKTNGTVAGTQRLSTIGVKEVNYLTSVDKVLFFASLDSKNSFYETELWKFGNDTTSGAGGSTALFEVKSEDHAISVYPNPAKDVVNISVLDDAKILAVSLYDITGKILETLDVTKETITHNISNLNNGQYIYTIKTNSGVIIKRLVVNK